MGRKGRFHVVSDLTRIEDFVVFPFRGTLGSQTLADAQIIFLFSIGRGTCGIFQVSTELQYLVYPGRMMEIAPMIGA